MPTVTTPDNRRVIDQRIDRVVPLTTPALLHHELPLEDDLASAVVAGRRTAAQVLDRIDDRLLVVVGPCSVHDPAAALEYAHRLREAADRVADDLLVVMRVYFEKPRSTVGWKGLINDPGLDGSGDVNAGLRLARALLLDVLRLGLPVGCEFLDPITPQYIADTVAWGAIGARTVESQVHRQLASGLSMPIGMKNRPDGSIATAVDAIRAAGVPHVFPGIDVSGTPAIMHTRGNADGHLVLRGGGGRPNYDAASVAGALELLRAAGLPERLVVDASHANSGKDHRNQPAVVADVAGQIAAGQRGIVGIMLESFLVPGRQDLDPTRELTYGQSITDACIGWDTTDEVLTELAAAVRARRATRSSADPHSLPAPA
ncbi:MULTISPECIES: 3-deoxy-7-phosphoheptulonate synthase [Micromonospora]|uniref:Phospho-2-dehydro-3-deoxyheptonate aldolase n=1 Tax=Micromonospora maris TaxID=1003110 RepID=A0A9X0LDH0_9ACTN|nr:MULTISPECIES: 3-deoxy-7-phosphoheptulonate synthase [Micromonospora]KUJ46058.1 phospho-2-dehydro-3-deoxyheptonate aldolase [Micromonospora maris]RUL90429.1 3-deoxy-7-phosphoheptulonate synthase [Verrucosispora sp. FIM060022]